MWQPEEDSLKMLVDLLNESQVPNNEKQRQIHNKITELSSKPEFACYLIYILSLSDSSINTLRRIAGAILKGVIERNFDKISSQYLDYIKLKLMEAFNDGSSMIRGTVANAITALFTKIGFQNWPELMVFLILNLDIDHQEYVQSSLECTYKILEDITTNADFNYNDEKYQNFVGDLVPKLLFLCDPKLPPKIKELSIGSLNMFVDTMPLALSNRFNDYFEMLYVSSQDQSADVRRKSCEGFLEIVETKKQIIAQNLQKTLEKMLQLTTDQDGGVKKISCRFWNEYLALDEEEGVQQRIEALREYLSTLMPILLNCLVYTEEDVLNNTEEKFEMMKPNRDSNVSDGDQSDRSNPSKDWTGNTNDKEGEQGAWTLRREATVLLNKVAERYKEETFLRSQERIAEHLKSNDWHVKETGILCLGVLAKDAYQAILPHFNDLFPFLLQSADDINQFVRSTSCWAMSRYTEWIVEQGKQDQQLITTYLQKVLHKMMDESGRVQEAACSALSRIAFLNPPLIEKYVYDIIEIIKRVYEHYKKKSLTNLYDVIASLALTIPKEKLQELSLQNTILEIIMKKWNESPFNDRESISLVECTDSIISMIGTQAVATYGEFFIARLLFLIFNYIQSRKEDDRKYLYHKKEIALACFELLSTFLKNIGEKAEKFIASDDYLTIFSECMQDQDLAIRRDCLASGGQIAKYCHPILQGKVEKIAQAYIDNLFVVSEEYDPGKLYSDCCNNGAWAVGEIALAYPNEFMSIVPQFGEKISNILADTNIKKDPLLDQNLAVALGRLGLVNPEAIAALLENFLKPFCVSLDQIKNDPEKQQAFRGLFLAISKNPNGIVKDFVFLCSALVNFENAEADLHELALKLVVNFKALAGQFWDSYFVSFPPELQEKMKQRFGV